MSFDLRLDTVCNHRIYKELESLDADRKSLRVSKPMASSSNIDVYASENYVSPTEYTVIYDPTTLTINQPRMILFNSKWDSVEDFFEVSYNTTSEYCPKCAGSNSVTDISYDVRGQLSVLRNENLLVQNMEKFTVTELYSNAFHSFIGTSLVTLIGKRITDMDYLATKITQEIQSTLARLKDLQQQYARTGRTVTKGELLDRIIQVLVTRNQNDPTIVNVDVTAMAQSGNTITFTQFMRVSS